MSLTVVPDTYTETETDTQEATFEGSQVKGLRARLVSTSGLELGEDCHRLDEISRLLVTARVTRVDHVVEERSGDLVRVETFKIVEATEVDWDTVAGFLS